MLGYTWLGLVFSSSASILVAAFNIGMHTKFAANSSNAEYLHHQSSCANYSTMLLKYDGMIEERKLSLMFYVNYLTWNVDPLNRCLDLVCPLLILRSVRRSGTRTADLASRLNVFAN